MGKGAGRRRQGGADGDERFGGAESESLTDDQLARRRKGTITGIGIIAFGLISAVYGYFRDSDSMDFSSMLHAPEFAVLHAVLWTVVGAGVIFWYSGPGIAQRAEGDNDERWK